MAWDLMLDPATGDFVFDGKGDLASVMDAPLVNQRMMVRCMIPLGSFQDDTTYTLGSTLASMTAREKASSTEVSAAIEAALAPMTDIQIQAVRVDGLDENDEVTDDASKIRSVLAQIDWSPASAHDEAADEENPELPTFTANIELTV